MKAKAKHNKAMAAIHAAKRQLGMDDDVYRAMLLSVTGKRSAKELTQAEVGKVLDRMRAAGANFGGHKGKPKNLDSHPQMQKIEALLAELKAPWAYADAIAKQQTGVEKVAWVRDKKQLSGIIAALDKELKKRRSKG